MSDYSPSPLWLRIQAALKRNATQWIENMAPETCGECGDPIRDVFYDDADDDGYPVIRCRACHEEEMGSGLGYNAATLKELEEGDMVPYSKYTGGSPNEPSGLAAEADGIRETTKGQPPIGKTAPTSDKGDVAKPQPRFVLEMKHPTKKGPKTTPLGKKASDQERVDALLEREAGQTCGDPDCYKCGICGSCGCYHSDEGKCAKAASTGELGRKAFEPEDLDKQLLEYGLTKDSGTWMYHGGRMEIQLSNGMFILPPGTKRFYKVEQISDDSGEVLMRGVDNRDDIHVMTKDEIESAMKSNTIKFYSAGPERDFRNSEGPIRLLDQYHGGGGFPPAGPPNLP